MNSSFKQVIVMLATLNFSVVSCATARGPASAAQAVPVEAARAKLESGFLVKATLNFKAGERHSESTHQFILSEDNKTWVTLTDNHEGPDLQGRLVKADDDSIEIAYAFVEEDQTEPPASPKATLVAHFGEPAKVTEKRKRLGVVEEVTVDVVIERTEIGE